MEKLETSNTVDRNVKWCNFYRKQFSSCSRFPPYMSLQGTCPRERKTYVHTKTWMLVFIAAIVVITTK